jgi:hypothetical protein
MYLIEPHPFQFMAQAYRQSYIFTMDVNCVYNDNTVHILTKHVALRLLMTFFLVKFQLVKVTQIQLLQIRIRRMNRCQTAELVTQK